MPSTVTARERAIAHAADVDITTVERLGAPLLRDAVRIVSEKALAEYRARRSFPAALQAVRANLPRVLTGAVAPAMTYAALLAARRVFGMLTGTGADMRAIKFADATPLATAAARQARRLDMPVAAVRRIARRANAVALEVVRGATAAAERHVREALAATIKSGLHVREGVERLQAALDAAGVGPLKQHLAETLFRTQTMLAYAGGEQDILADPAVAEFHWGYKYVTVGDDRVRPTHIAMEGTTLPKDDPFWDTSLAPNGWNCRCRCIPIFDERRESRPPRTIRVDGEPVAVVADEGFAFRPGRILAPAA